MRNLSSILSSIASAATLLAATQAASAQTPTNGLLREVYEGITGGTLADLTNNAAFPDSPTSRNIVTDYFEAPTDIMDYYGQRMRALILPPTTGSYTFWIASDDASGLYLSMDETPANRQAIAWVSGWTPSRNWAFEANQQSSPVSLQAGKKYYIEALMKENEGGDNLAVRWQLPDGTIEEPIPATRLLVYGLGAPVITAQPQNIGVAEGGLASFSVQISEGYGAMYQWRTNGATLPAATNGTLAYGPATLADNGLRFSCVISNSQGFTNSTEAVLKVVPDTAPPAISAVSTPGGRTTVTVIFTEPVEAASALDASHYVLNNGAGVLSAQFAGDTSSVVLQTTPLTAGVPYTLGVSGVRDLATSPNTIAAGTKAAFQINVVPLPIGLVTQGTEPLGPSNRRWGVVVSEIMYHPAARDDGRNLEYIEIFNTFDWSEDISGWQITGEINYTFPANTTLAKRSFLAVAPVPDDLKAVYGINNVVGGFTNNLSNASGKIRLVKPNGDIIFEADYSSQPPFPASADGAGHSLVLARPSYGEGNPMAWAASEKVGGSPGIAEPAADPALRTVLINEFLAHTTASQSDFVELYNYSTQSVDLAGCVLTDNPNTNKCVIPQGTIIPALGFVSFDESQLGFGLSSSGETIYFINPAGTRVLDSVRFGPQALGISTGRQPDGAPDFRKLAAPTPGTNNTDRFFQSVVINEIMYKPVTGDDNDQYVELYNQGKAAVDLSGWTFADGLKYTFPAGTVMPAGGYFVVCRNVTHLLTNYPGLTPAITFGDFQGSMAKGRHIALARPEPVLSTNASAVVSTNWIDVVVDEVSFEKGGAWPAWANGGGSSLELIDPHADRQRAANWGASDETGKSAWTTVEWTGVLDLGVGGYGSQLQILMQDAGECLVDNVEVLKQGANLVSNPTLDSGMSGWVAQGSHSVTTWQSTGGVNNSGCLHVCATGRGDPGANRVRNNLLASLNEGDTATLRAKVRWLKGWPEVLLRLRGNWLEAPGKLAIPTNLGTPGARNSCAASNAGPAIFAVSHSPVLPTLGQNVTVRARVDDSDGLASLVLKYRVDPATNYTVVNMNYNGAGYYSAVIPVPTTSLLVAFYIQATDAAATPVQTVYPAGAPNHECLVRFAEPKPAGNFGNYHLWLTQKAVQLWTAREKLANSPIDATFVYGDSRVIYSTGALYAGSPFLSPSYTGPIGGACGYVLEFPEDDPCLNDTQFTLDWPKFEVDGSGQLEHIAFWLAEQLGTHGCYRRYINLFVNGAQRGAVYEDCLQPGGDVIGEVSPKDDNGDLYKLDDGFEFDDAGSGFTRDNGDTAATIENFTTTGGVKKTARYRWHWKKRAVNSSANDYQSVFNLVNAANTADATALVNNFGALVDVNQWMRVFAVEHIMVNWDSYGFRRGKNMYTYKPANGKWMMLPWDIDFLLQDAQQDVFETSDPVLSRIYSTPVFRRLYLQAIQDAATGPMLVKNVGPLLDNTYTGLLANGISVSDTSDAKSRLEQRRQYLLTVLNNNLATFKLTINNGLNFVTNASLVTITGSAPLDVRQITINGVAYPLTWISATTWSARVALSAGANTLVVRGYDRSGALYTGATASLTINYTGAIQLPQDYVVINEIMYHPAVTGAEYVELYNRSTTTTFDLSGWRLDGLGFTFPDGLLLEPGKYLVLARDTTQFAAAYGASIPIAAVYPGQLSHGGEHLRLVKPGADASSDVIVSQVKYGDAAPWPVVADGQGPSLQLIDPAQDCSRVGNWVGASTNAAVLYTPGAVNSVRSTLAAFLPLWINEVQPENISGPSDAAGHREPWIELYNSGSNPISLSGLCLSDNYTNLTQWAFPQGATIGGNTFLTVWADGNTQETTANEFHANFRPTANSGNIALSMTSGAKMVICDYLNYKNVGAGRSYGDYPDGQPFSHQVFQIPTPGTTNNPACQPIQVFINEWMASNTHTLADPADDHFDDWFELYNAGSEAVDLGGYTLTDTPTNTTQFAIPAGTSIAAGDFLLVWADNDTNQNNPTNRAIHTNFKLSQQGETIGLFDPNGGLVDMIVFEQQTSDVSQGRWPDGAAEPFFFMENPTPDAPNRVSSSNRPPVLTLLTNAVVNEGALLTFTATASDLDTNQTLTFSLANAPAGATIDPVTGVFAWTPTEAQGPGIYIISVRATDDGEPPLTALKRVTITVNEVNTTPAFPVISNKTIDEGQPFSLNLAATDADLPAQSLTYSLDANPAGAALDAITGVFTWTPSEVQGPGTYDVTVRATDNGTPAMSDVRTFQITVREVNTAPRIQSSADLSVMEGETLSFQVIAADDDLPAQTLSFGLDAGAPAGMSINAAMGLLTWTPASGQIPSTNTVTVRVSDNGEPPLSASQTFRVLALKMNHAPALAPIADQYMDEITSLRLVVTATDADSGQTLTYSLDGGSPAGMVIDGTTGVLRWIPNEAQGPYTNIVTVRVTDNGVPPRDDARSFRVVVREVNTPPVLNPIPDQSLLRGQSLSLKVTASDSDLPANKLKYELVSGAPAGMTLDASTGMLQWNPTLEQVPGTNTILVRVTDDGTPALSDQRAFTVIVNDLPAWTYCTYTGTGSSSILYIYLTAPGELYLDDLQIVSGSVAGVGANLLTNGDFESALTGPWTVSPNLATSTVATNMAHSGHASLHVVDTVGGTTKASSIYQTLTTTLSSTATYTLSFWCLPGTNTANLVVRLSGSGINFNQSIASVKATNQPPVITDYSGIQEVVRGQPLEYPLAATDPDAGQILRFSLAPGAPVGTTVDPLSGTFAWTPPASLPAGLYPASIRVFDNGAPVMSATTTLNFLISDPPVELRILNISARPGQNVALTWASQAGVRYQVQAADQLTPGAWADLGSAVTATNANAACMDLPPSGQARFYRVTRLP
jgi:hypothetical protein